MKKENIISAVVGAIVLIVGIYIGAHYFGLTVHNSYGAAANSATGTTFANAKVAQINFSLALNTATTTSILNTDSFDRIVTDAFGYCSGVGTSNTPALGPTLEKLTMRAATTSTSAPVSFLNGNYVMNNTVSTSTPDSYFASTTATMTATSYQRVWGTGSYMTFASNATNTAACTVGVHYIGS